MVYEQVLYSVNKRVATVTLDRPERLNAWTRLMAEEVCDAMGRASTDDVVRVIVLTGAGRGFCAGADMADLKGVASCGVSQPTGSENNEEVVSFLTGTKTEEQRDPENRLNTRSDFRKRYSYFPAIPKPVIAAINGPAAGLGLIVVLYCDLRFASDRASFSTAFSRRGLIAEHGIAWLLPKIAGLSNALDLPFFVTHCRCQRSLPPGPSKSGFPGARVYGRRLCLCVRSGYDSFTTSLRIMKKQVWDGQFQSLVEAASFADENLVLSLQSDDFREGVAHFFERRPPAFSGK